MTDAGRTLIHTPAPPSGAVQRCVHCAVILIDHRGEMRLSGDQRPGRTLGGWWTSNVEMFVVGGGAWSTHRPANCTKAAA